MANIVFQPDGFRVSDTMPFFEGNTFYLYHYKTRQGIHQEAYNWTLSSTEDFLRYKDHGELFRHGTKGERDYVFRSGTLLKTNGLYHFFYGGDDGAEHILHASGSDLESLDKDDFLLNAQSGYNLREWRDPFVFFSEERDEYVMVLGTRKTNGQNHLDGCTVWFTSKNLKRWKFEGDLFASGAYTTLEMPDLFKEGDWWYHIVSEYSDETQVIYRMSKNMSGPWTAPEDDGLDGAAYFAGRTCLGWDGRRYLFGWIADKEMAEDRADWTGGGGLWMHEVFVQQDASLGVRIPQKVYDVFAKETVLSETPFTIDAPFGREEKTVGQTESETFMLEADVSFCKGTRRFSLNLLRNGQTGEAYEIRFDVGRGIMMINRSPNHGIVPPDHFRGMERLTRPVKLSAGKKYHIRIVYDDTYIIVYLNGKALSGRLYSRFGLDVSVSVANGSLNIDRLVVKEFLK